jgi:integral membrane sensor domain MASE1
LRVAVCVFVGYYLGARLGLALTFLPTPASVLWPPNAVMLAAMLVSPARLWWAIVAGAFPAHLLAELQGGVPAPMVLSWFVSNSAEALIGAGCVCALRREPITFDRLLDVGAFMLAAFVGAFLSSFVAICSAAMFRECVATASTSSKCC